MNTGSGAAEHQGTLLSGWERALLTLPAAAGLALGFILLLLPELFAAFANFPVDDVFIFRLAGAPILGYGVGLTISLFQPSWRMVRLVVIGVLANNLGSLYACGAAILRGQPSFFVYLVLAGSILFVIITGVLLVRHFRVPPLETENARDVPSILFVVGAVAAGVFGIFPLFVPEFFRTFHLAINAPFVIQQAGAASLGYAVIAVLAQRASSRRELLLPLAMAGIFNGAGGLVSLFYIRELRLFPLPQLIAPVGLLVLVAAIYYLRQVLIPNERRAITPGMG